MSNLSYIRSKNKLENKLKILESLSVDQLNYFKNEYIKYEKRRNELIKKKEIEVNLFKEQCNVKITILRKLLTEQNNILSSLKNYKSSFFKNFICKFIGYQVKEYYIDKFIEIGSDKYKFPYRKENTLEHNIRKTHDDCRVHYYMRWEKANLDGSIFVKKLENVQLQIETVCNEIVQLEFATFKKIENINSAILGDCVEIEKGKKNKVLRFSNFKLIEIEKSIDINGKKEREKAKIAAYDKKARSISPNIKRKLNNQLKIYPKCPYCHKDIDRDAAHADHIYPVTKGGQSVSKNMVFVCSSCNLAKGKLTLRTFLIKNNINKELTYTVLEQLGKDF